MSSTNLELVRSIYADWGRGEFQSADWADPKIEFTGPGSVEAGVRTGLAGMAEGWRSWLSVWDAYHAAAEEYRLLDDGRVVVIGRMSAVDLRGLGAWRLQFGRAGAPSDRVGDRRRA